MNREGECETITFGDARLPERIWAKAAIDERGCWIWSGFSHSSGYGIVRWDGKAHQRLHRVAFEVLVGPIGDGLVVHHRCETPACFNPAHLEPTTHADNIRASRRPATHCRRGHEFTADNTYVNQGRQNCRTCLRERNARPKEARPAIEILDERLPERFWAKIELGPDGRTGCWRWAGSHSKDGYPRYAGDRGFLAAYRYSYEALVGPIPTGMTLDHLCFEQKCVNPAHLDPVSSGENSRRANLRRGRWSVCINGHELNDETFHVDPKSGNRRCKICQNERVRQHRLRRLASDPDSVRAASRKQNKKAWQKLKGDPDAYARRKEENAAWREAHPDAVREYGRRHRTGEARRRPQDEEWATKLAERSARMAAAYRTGNSIEEIAAAERIVPAYAQQLLARAARDGLCPSPAERRRERARDREEAREAQRRERRPARMRRSRDAADGGPRPVGRAPLIPPDERPVIVARRAAGESVALIAADCGVSVGVIYAILNAARDASPKKRSA